MGFSLNPIADLSSVLHTGEKIIGDGANDFKNAVDNAAKVVTHMSPVWDPTHIEDRLRDHYLGRPNKWVEDLKIKSGPRKDSSGSS